MSEAMPLLARVSATDWIEGGWDLRACEALLAGVSSRGLDFIDVSSGGLSPLAGQESAGGRSQGSRPVPAGLRLGA